MKTHFELTDNEFESQFKACTLAPSLFTHEAHLRLAWIHVRNYGIEQAISNIENQLHCYVAGLGEKNKYNTTLTIAAVKTVHHFILKSSSHNFKDFITEFPRLKTHFKELVKQHYSFDIYNSNKAKAKYLEPDLLPFD